MDKLNEAVQYATKKHEGQIRRGVVNLPYITHPLNVTKILQDTGSKDEVLIAAVLHDVVEDTKTPIQEITQKFGDKVSKLVASVTEKGIGMTWDERLVSYMNKVRNATADTKKICAADKIDNMQSMINCVREGYDIFSHMHAGKDKQINKFKMIIDTIGGDIGADLSKLYKSTLKQLINATKHI